MKGLSITGLILGIVGTAAGITGVTLSAIGLAKCKSQEFQNSFQTSFLSISKEKTFLIVKHSLRKIYGFTRKTDPNFGRLSLGVFLENISGFLYN